jgi:hypothetical protein
MLAFISLTTPLLLTGLTLLSLPLIAHLLQRHARRRLVFPTVAFLLAAAATQSRFHKFKRWLLLLLRLAAVACIVLAFTRPVWLDVSPAQAGAEGQPVAVALLIDCSASAGQQVDGVSLVERLRAAANRTLDSIRSGTDVANIVYADAAPHAAFPRMSPNLSALRSELEKLSATQERADLATAIAVAGRMLTDHRGPTRLVVLSDLQATNWSDALRDASLSQLLPSGTLVTVADIDAEVPENIALGSPSYYPPQPIAGQTCELTIHVSNFSDRTRQAPVSLEVRLADDSSAVYDQTVTLNPGESRDVLFSATAPESGPLLATFSVPGDALEVDNHAYLVLEAAARIPVLIVSDDSPDEPGTAAYYMLRALAPHGDATDRFDVRLQRSFELNSATLNAVSGVFVGYVGDLPAASAKALVDYMDRGGGVVFFCGEGPVGRNLEAIESAAGARPILPWPPGLRRESTGRQEPYHITAGRWQSRWFREFDEQSQLAIAQIRFERSWYVSAPSPETEVLLSFSDGQPALGSRLFGQGQFLVANFSPETNASDLGKHGAFVAWMQILARSLMPEGAAARPSPPGVPYQFPRLFAADAVRGSAEVTGPDGKPVLSTTTTFPEGVRVDVPDPKVTGIYRVRGAEGILGAAAINLDPRESDLRRIEADRLTQQLRGQGIQTETASASGWEPVLDLQGRPLWGSFFVAALCAIGLELFLLGLWKH